MEENMSSVQEVEGNQITWRKVGEVCSSESSETQID